MGNRVWGVRVCCDAECAVGVAAGGVVDAGGVDAAVGSVVRL